MVAIIAILAALLFPVLSAARDRARTVQCQSNLRQIGAALKLYLGDADDAFPLESWCKAQAAYQCRPITWKDALFPYLRSKDVFLCPTNPVGWTRIVDVYPTDFNDNLCCDGWWKLPGDEINRFPVSYDANDFIFRSAFYYGVPMKDGTQTVSTQIKGADLSDIPATADTIAVGETRGWDLDFSPMVYGFGNDVRTKSTTFHTHQGRVQFLFVDGHVRSMKAIQTFRPHSLWGPNSLILESEYNVGLKLKDLPIDPIADDSPLVRDIRAEYR